MYRLLEINDSAATRDLVIKNELTNTIDVCFDDSELLNLENFNFVKINTCYNCKIYLLGESDKRGEEFIVIGEELVGRKRLTKIKNQQGDYYYIPYLVTNKEEQIKFTYSRKDIIEIDGRVHPDFI